MVLPTVLLMWGAAGRDGIGRVRNVEHSILSLFFSFFFFRKIDTSCFLFKKVTTKVISSEISIQVILKAVTGVVKTRIELLK